MHTGSFRPLTTSSMTYMTSLTAKLLVNFVINLVFVCAFISNREENTTLIGHLMRWFGVYQVGMVCMTLAHAQVNYHVSQFGIWIQDKTDSYQNSNATRFSLVYVLNYLNLPFYADKEAITILLSKSGFYMMIRLGGNMQWQKLTDWTGLTDYVGDELDSAPGGRDYLT